MKKLILLLVLLCVPFVSASLEYPYYMDFNTSELICYNIINFSVDYPDHNITLNFNGTSTNLSVVSNSSYCLNVTSVVEEDVDFFIGFGNITSGVIFVASNGTMRFRIPYYLNITFWQASNWTDTSIKPYLNEFQFVYMQFTNGSYVNPLPDLSYMDDMFSFMPFYKKSFSNTMDNTLSFWGVYDGGSATIKLYEVGTYTLGIVSNSVMGFVWPYEFVYPQYGSSYKSKILNNVEPLVISTKDASDVKVYISMWEVSKFNVLGNLAYNMAILVFGVLFFIVLFKFGGIGTALIGSVGFVTLMKLLGLVLF